MVEISTFNELHQKLDRAVEKSFGQGSYVIELFLNKQEFIYQNGQKLFRVEYTMNSAGDVVLGESIEVERSTTFPKVG